MKKKLEFSFDLFDTNDNGDLTSDELNHGLHAMLKLLVNIYLIATFVVQISLKCIFLMLKVCSM
jgi:hypothetical protein